MFLAIDWGTTNRRVYAIDAAGTVVASERDDRGVLAIAREEFAAEVAGIRLRFGDLPILCAGMVGSVRGWVEVQALIEQAARGERRIVFPDFPDAMDWTWIDDAAEVLLHAMERPLPPCAVLNVVGDKRPVRDAMAHLARRFPDLELQARPARTPPAAWSLVNDGIGAMLGVVPATTLEQGIDRMLATPRSDFLPPR